jgi:hypothetical protein
MDPMEAMSSTVGPLPKDFNATEAENSEDVRPTLPRHPLLN